MEYVDGGSKDTELALANLGCIPVHVWPAAASHEQQPDWMVFDLDPTSGKFTNAAKAGIVVKNELDDLGLASYPKTSGSRGLHVFVPLRLGPTYDDVLPFAKEICGRLAAEHPKELTMEQRLCAPRAITRCRNARKENSSASDTTHRSPQNVSTN